MIRPLSFSRNRWEFTPSTHALDHPHTDALAHSLASCLPPLPCLAPPPISFPLDQAWRPALPRRRRGDKGSPDASGSLPTRPLHPALPLRLSLSPPDPLTPLPQRLLPQRLRRRPPSSTQPPTASRLAGVSKSILVLAYVVYIYPFELNITTTWIGPVFLIFARWPPSSTTSFNLCRRRSPSIRCRSSTPASTSRPHDLTMVESRSQTPPSTTTSTTTRVPTTS
ncbi:proline-rich protein 36-like [Triticum dicoccoides]|uniref:proline-rich protein 36-like n=1 Tax=Triticum dicoccoides TaxID=85692 RepID=UPI00188FA3EF|nr:proline-rich protein 36-like [Triticum dicoccoides]